MSGNLGISMDQRILDELTTMRVRAGNPSSRAVGKAISSNHWTVQRAFNGVTVSWATLLKLLEFFGADEEKIAEIRNIWIVAKVTRSSDYVGPLWSKKLDEKLDRILKLLEDK